MKVITITYVIKVTIVSLVIEVVIIRHAFMPKARCYAPILIKTVIHERIVFENSQHPYLLISCRWEKESFLAQRRTDGQTSQSKQSLFSTALRTRLKTDKPTEERHSLTRLNQMTMTRNVSVVQLVA